MIDYSQFGRGMGQLGAFAPPGMQANMDSRRASELAAFAPKGQQGQSMYGQAQGQGNMYGQIGGQMPAGAQQNMDSRHAAELAAFAPRSQQQSGQLGGQYQPQAQSQGNAYGMYGRDQIGGGQMPAGMQANLDSRRASELASFAQGQPQQQMYRPPQAQGNAYGQMGAGLPPGAQANMDSMRAAQLGAFGQRGQQQGMQANGNFLGNSQQPQQMYGRLNAMLGQGQGGGYGGGGYGGQVGGGRGIPMDYLMRMFGGGQQGRWR